MSTHLTLEAFVRDGDVVIQLLDENDPNNGLEMVSSISVDEWDETAPLILLAVQAGAIELIQKWTQRKAREM